MSQHPHGDRIHREYKLLVVCNLVVIVGLGAGATWLVASDVPPAELWDRLGRAGPAGVVLLFGSLAVAWVELLLRPTLLAREHLHPGVTRREA